MSMTGLANTSLEGTALATKGEGCDGEGIYAEIIEVIESRACNDLKMIRILADEDGIILNGKKKVTLKIYGKFLDTGLVVLNNLLLDYLYDDNGIIAVDKNGVITPVSNGEIVLKVSYEDVFDTVNVKVIRNNISEEAVCLDEENTIIKSSNDKYLLFR